VVSSPLEQLSQSGTAIGPFRILLKYVENTKKTLNLEKIYCCGCAEESKGGDGDAAATAAHAVKKGDVEEEEYADAAAALPHAVAPVGAPSVCCYGGKRSVYCCGGAEESKGGGGEEEKDGDVASASPHAMAPVEALSVYLRRWRPWERQARRRRGFTASGEVIINRAAARSSAGCLKIQ
jgi:hypothetical protein